ncbi:MAG: ABC-type oligopeptide transport system, periplasmic component, partial [Clostridia bacterium]|nr:ABC-type oligopeptide transport system, periplasmic component [Clostridia bacterium]
LVVNGPFKLAAWERGHVIRYEKNPKYWNAKNIKIDIINAYVYFLNNDALQDYYDNNLDAMIIKGNESNIPKNEIKNNYSGTVWYVQFNNSDKAGILSNANIRKALSLSINRQEFLKLTGRETADPALSLVAPEIIPGKEKPFREEAGDLIKDNDLQAAKAALSLGLKEKKLTKLPELTLLISSGVISEKQGEVLTQMWKENLGINVKVVTKSFGEQMSEMYKGNYQMAIAGWGADYLDAMTYLEMFDSSVQPNQFGYKNTEFNSLIKSIKNEADTSKRIDLLKKAEKKLINEAVVAPLYFLYEKTAIKPNIKNVQFSPTGAKFDFTFADVVELERTFETADSKFSMKTNQNWHKQRVDDLDLMLIDSVDPIWVTVSSFSSTGSTSELNTYVDMEIKSRLKTSDSSKLIQKEKVRINSLEAVKYQISLSSSYLERVIYGVFISTPDKVYKVQFFAYPDVFQQRKAEIDKMINSITVAR